MLDSAKIGLPQTVPDAKPSRLPLGLKSSSQHFSLNPLVLAKALPEVFSRGNHGNQPAVDTPCADFSLTSLGELPVVASRQTPSIINEDEPRGSSTLAICLAGDEVEYREGKYQVKIQPKSVFLNPRHGGIATTGYLSGIYCQIDHKRLHATIQAINPGKTPISVDQPLLFKPSKKSCLSSDIIAFFSFIDSLLRENQTLPAALGLDDMLYRMLALSLLNEGDTQGSDQRNDIQNWNWKLDDLVDYIKANSHLPLSITDLERISHYSARHLQYTFKDKLNCTPMQFLRNQRLSKAMERLQRTAPGDTIAGVARECGYTNSQHFSRDFQKRFGIRPSTVLRHSQK
jgi:AraC-like DNA-binding protein